MNYLLVNKAEWHLAYREYRTPMRYGTRPVRYPYHVITSTGAVERFTSLKDLKAAVRKNGWAFETVSTFGD